MRDWLKLVAWAIVLVVASWIPIALGWSGLPEPVASHWNIGGVPDGAMPRAGLWLLPPIIVAFGLITGAFLRNGSKPSATAAALVGSTGGVSVWVTTVVVRLNHNAGAWDQAGSFGLWQVAGVVLAGAVLGWLGYVLGKRWFPVDLVDSGPDLPTLDLAENERATWTGSVRVMWPLWLLLPVALLFLVLPGWFKAQAPIFAALALLLSRLSVVVDHNCLRVKLAGALTVRRIKLQEVASARPLDLEPSQWGGWGYRVLANGSAVVLRGGDAIEVRLANGRRFAVTVDDAATGAALLNGLVQRQPAAG